MTEPKQKLASNRRTPAKKKTVISENFTISRNSTPLKAILDAAENQASKSIDDNNTAVPQYRSSETIKQKNLETTDELKDILINKHLELTLPEYHSTAVPTSTTQVVASNYYKKPNNTVDKIDRNLTAAESRVLDHLIRLSIGFNKTSCQVRVSTLQERTGYRSDKTIREAINGLISKNIIARQTHHNSPLGDHYKILINSGNTVIDSGNSEIKSVINSGNGEIKSVIDSGNNSGNLVPQYRSTQVKNTAVLEVKNTGDLKTIKDNINDDNLINLLKEYFPNLDQQEIDNVIKEIHSLLSETLRQKITYSKGNIVSPNYFIECVRRLTQEQNKTKPLNQKQQLKQIVERVKQTNVGRNLSFSDLVEDVKRICARENIVFDNDLFNEVLEKK